MKYKCNNCGFIHFGEMPDGYYCPLCHANFSYFELVDEEEKKYNRKTVDKNNPSINRVYERCINCGVCTRTCENIVGIKCDGVCIKCGQCIMTCPTGALTPKYDYKKVMEYISDPEYTVIALTSPAVRVGIGDAFGYKPGDFLEGKMVAALKKIGFDYVFDTTFGADLTSMEEAFELKDRLEKKSLMFSSCCPSWVNYVSIYHPELLPNLSTCKSPIGMEASVIRNFYLKEDGLDPNKTIIVAVTPCTSKKHEIINSDCDLVITTSELSHMIRELNIDFKLLDESEFDTVNGSSSGTIYGASSGVTLSVIRVLFYYLTGRDLTSDEIAIKNKGYYTEIKFKANKQIITCAVVSTIPNLEKLLTIKDEFNFIEVMNCDGGCINGGGQVLMPQNERDKIKNARIKALFKKDIKPYIKYPYKNPIIKDLYEDYLEEPGSKIALKVLHVKHKDLSNLINKKED